MPTPRANDPIGAHRRMMRPAHRDVKSRCDPAAQASQPTGNKGVVTVEQVHAIVAAPDEMDAVIVSSRLGDRIAEEIDGMAITSTEAQRARQAQTAVAADEVQAAAPRAADLLETFTPERTERYVHLTERLVGGRWSGRDPTSFSLAAAALSGLAGPEEALVARCSVEAKDLGRALGWWRCFALGIDTAEQHTVAARLRATGDGEVAPLTRAVADEVVALRRDGFSAAARLAPLAAELVRAAPEAEARRAWRQRAAALWRELRAQFSWWSGLPPANAQRMLFALVRQPEQDPAALARAIACSYQQLQAAKVGSKSGRFLAALLFATVARDDQQQTLLIERMRDLERRLLRHSRRVRARWWKRRDMSDSTDATPVVALLALADGNLDVLVGLLGALRAQLAEHGVHQGTPLTYLLLLDDIASARPALRPLVDACADLFVRQVQDEQAAILATTAVATGG
jgi:hypothetical protein